MPAPIQRIEADLLTPGAGGAVKNGKLLKHIGD